MYDDRPNSPSKVKKRAKLRFISFLLAFTEIQAGSSGIISSLCD